MGFETDAEVRAAVIQVAKTLAAWARGLRGESACRRPEGDARR
jgi:hypothetical protein